LQARDVDADVVRVDAHGLAVRGFLERLGCVDERLGWDTPDVEAHAAGRRALDHHDLFLQLSQPDAGHVAAGARADHDDFHLDDVRAHVAILSIESRAGRELPGHRAARSA
jgi:hypothetical protein